MPRVSKRIVAEARADPPPKASIKKSARASARVSDEPFDVIREMQLEESRLEGKEELFNKKIWPVWVVCVFCFDVK